jgi:hypothetical protein
MRRRGYSGRESGTPIMRPVSAGASWNPPSRGVEPYDTRELVLTAAREHGWINMSDIPRPLAQELVAAGELVATNHPDGLRWHGYALPDQNTDETDSGGMNQHDVLRRVIGALEDADNVYVYEMDVEEYVEVGGYLLDIVDAVLAVVQNTNETGSEV